MKQLAFVVVVLNTIAAQTSNDSVIHCGDECLRHINDTAPQSTNDVEENMSCDVTEMVETPWDEGLPGPKAVFEDARWYVRVQRGERRLAFNITWFEKGSWTEQNLRNGYLIQIVPSASIQVTYNVKVRVSGERLMNGNNRYGKIYLNYQCFGLSENTAITPGTTYLIVLKTLPFAPENADNLFDHSVVHVPECEEDAAIKTTKNCEFEDYSSFEYPELRDSEGYDLHANYDGTTTAVTPNALHETDCCDYSLYIIGGVSVFAAIGLLIFLVIVQRRKRWIGNFPVNKQIVFIIDTLEADGKPTLAQAGDELARALEPFVAGVAYSLWSATEISRRGLVEWVTKNVVLADTVVMLCTHGNRNRSSEHSDESPCLSGGMNETLLTILRNQAECVPELVAVHFSGKKKKCNLTPHSYTLPNDTGAFLATTVGKALPRATVEHVQRRMSYWLNQDCDKSSQALRNATLGGDPELTELVLPIHSA